MLFVIFIWHIKITNWIKCDLFAQIMPHSVSFNEYKKMMADIIKGFNEDTYFS